MTTAPANYSQQSAIAPEGVEYAVQIFEAILAVAPDHCPEVVRRLAAASNLGALRTVLDSGLIGSDFPYAARLVSALAPIAARSDLSEVETALVSSWLKLLDMDTPEKLGAALPNLFLVSEVRDLVRVFGADPLAITAEDAELGYQSYTGLGRAVVQPDFDQVFEMLPVLLEQGRLPIAQWHPDGPRSVFDIIAQAELFDAKNYGQRNASARMLAEMAELGIPKEWEYLAGQTLLRYMADKGTIDHRSDHAILEMMGVARFDDPAKWLEVMRGSDLLNGIAITLLDVPRERLALRVISNMKRDVVNLNDIAGSAFSQNMVATMPLLHAAAAKDRKPIVEALLEAGCNPGPAIHTLAEPDSKSRTTLERSAADVATPGSESHKLLLAINARNSIEAVLANTFFKSAAP